jgi:proteasome inhibitor subunit 1 (PI31)
VASIDIATNDFTSPSFFPYNLSGTDVQPLVHGFISSNRVTDFTAQIKLKVLQKLIPGLRKEGYTEEPEEESVSAAGSAQAARQPPPGRPQVVTPPEAPEHERMPRPHIPPDNPLEIGRRDLDPIPMNPFAPPPLFPNSGDGMFVGPDHPIFDNRRQPSRSPFGDHGPWGGDGFLPPTGAPPGARFDPVGPGPFPPRRGGGGFPGRGNMHGPDNDEFMPPGMVSDISLPKLLPSP